jgi:hypothetical protein
MEALVQEIDVEELAATTTAEKIGQFRKKYNHETFIAHLKEGVEEGRAFDFDVQKVIDGTETEEEAQARYRLEKQTWGKLTQERV